MTPLPDQVMQKAPYVAGAAGGAAGGLTGNDWLAVVGCLVMVLTFIVNTWFKWRDDKRKQEAHQTRDRRQRDIPYNGPDRRCTHDD